MAAAVRRCLVRIAAWPPDQLVVEVIYVVVEFGVSFAVVVVAKHEVETVSKRALYLDLQCLVTIVESASFRLAIHQRTN